MKVRQALMGIGMSLVLFGCQTTELQTTTAKDLEMTPPVAGENKTNLTEAKSTIDTEHVVKATTLHVREKPSEKGKILGVKSKGTKINVVGQKYGWAQFEGGWVYAKYLEKSK